MGGDSVWVVCGSRHSIFLLINLGKLLRRNRISGVV